MKKRLLNLTLGAVFAVALCTNARASTALWNFDDWVNGPETNLVFAGDVNAMLSEDFKQYSLGNPDTGGFLQLTPAIDSRNLVVVFPDIDNGAPVKAFKLTIDCRVGNGQDERPADGFSISYVRDGDVALSNAAVYVDPITGRGIAYGYAGGDDCTQAVSPAGGGNMENGSKTGVSILFDSWQGNELPNTASNPNCTPDNDVEGVAVRVDDKTLIQVAMSERNGPNGCLSTNSMQTGPWLNDGGWDFWTSLSWCQLIVEKTTDNKVNVTWKGRKILENYQLADYSVHRGRLLLAGRTGGNNQYVQFDNIQLETTPAVEPTYNSMAIHQDLRGWTVLIDDDPLSALTNVTQVLWNGADVTGQVTWSKNGGQTSVMLTQAGRLPALSSQQVRVTFQTSLAQTIEVVGSATVMNYFVMPTGYALPLTAVSSQPRGIVLGKPWQTFAENRNSQGDNKLNWTEEQILGLHGANLVTATVPTSTDVIDYQNNGPAGTPTANFQVGGSLGGLWEGADYGIADLGIGLDINKANTDDGAIEWFSYVHFPTAGDYTMVVNSDDGFRLTTARNSMDRMGDAISSYNAGRGSGTGAGAGTQQRVIIDQAGVYPIRGLIYNRGGGFNVEWYTRSGDQLYLVNSNATAQALQAWQSATGAGCYVKSAIPVRSAVDVAATQKLMIEVADGTTTVTPGSIVLKVDGATTSPTVTPGAPTTVELSGTGPGGLWTAGSHSVELTFNDSASTAYSYTWSFSVLPYKVITGGVPIGSQDPTKVGFMYSTWQVDPQGTTQLPNRIPVGEQVVQGKWGPNTATLASGPVSGVINFDITQGAQGVFTGNNGFPEALIPGIPGSTTWPNESFACEILTWVELPAAGMYSLAFNSDDGFWTQLGHTRPAKVGQLTISSPPSIAGEKGAVPPSYNGGQEVWATNDVSGEIVLTDPVNANTDLVNAAQVAGKIALCYRGVNSFADKIQKCAAAGAIGVIVVQSRPAVNPGEGVMPIEMGSTVGPLPAVMVHHATGNAITNALLTGPVTGTLNAQVVPSAALGFADVGRGATGDWWNVAKYNIYAPAPGLYPLRTMWWQGGGGGNCEWFSYDYNTQARALLNDLANSSALKCWYGVTVVVPPMLSVGRDGTDVVVTFEGTLQTADAVAGPYTDSPETSPYRSPINEAPKYFRAKR